MGQVDRRTTNTVSSRLGRAGERLSRSALGRSERMAGELAKSMSKTVYPYVESHSALKRKEIDTGYAMDKPGRYYAE